MKLSRKFIYSFFMIISLGLAITALVPRVATEKSNNNFAFVLNFRDLLALSKQASISNDAVWDKLSPYGVLALSAPEYTGEEIEKYHPMGSSCIEIDGKAAVLLAKNSPYITKFAKYLDVKIPGTIRKDYGDKIAFVLPATTETLFVSSVLPDFEALEFGKSHNIPLLFRLGSCNVADGKKTAMALKLICDEYPQVKNVLPSGFIIAGNPDFQPIADFMKERNISLSQVEFFKQVGASNAFVDTFPEIIPLHSLTTDEVISKNISRTSTIDRYIRAIHERSVRLILVRPFDLLMGNRLEAFTQDLGRTKMALLERGYKAEWPNPYKPWTRSRAAIIALALVFVSTIWIYGAKLANAVDENASIAEIILLVALMSIYAAGLWKISLLAKLTGGICTGFVAAVAALYALKGKKYALPALFIIFAGGLTVASFYGTAKAALRILPFSGVKLTLLLPPLLILYHDLKLRVHDESISELVVRPAVWGELIIVGVMMLAMLVMALRSDNVSNVPAYELAFRDFLERTLAIRPRTKEILIGYPALVLYWYVARNKFLPHYREVLRIAASLAFCSAMNTFCHFHTRLMLSVIRVLNGWCVGLVIGTILTLVIAFVVNFLTKKRSVA